MKKIRIILLTSIISINVNAQNCNCESSFEWLKKTFEQNDAGFKYYIKQKGNVNYNLLNSSIQEKSKSIKSTIQCQALLIEWLHFFRTEHIGINLINQSKSKPNLLALK